MGKIKSDTISARNAISELVGVDTSDKQNQQVEFSYTTEIAGMEAGRQACNQCCMLSVTLAQLSWLRLINFLI